LLTVNNVGTSYEFPQYLHQLENNKVMNTLIVYYM